MMLGPWAGSAVAVSLITLPAGAVTPKLAGGGYHSLALKGDGTIWAWGWNGGGQLGNGTTTDQATPVQVVGPTGAVSVAASYLHRFAVMADGTVWAWGRNSYGTLGDGTTTARLIPLPVPGLSGMVAVAAVGGHSLALKSDGTVWAWGNNSNGQLGDGTTGDRMSPVQVTGLAGVTAVAAGGAHSLALKADGTVWAWGNNENGQLGDGTTTDRLSPVQIPALTGIVALAAGYRHSLAIQVDGTIWTWGRNSYGALGDGTTTDRQSPVAADDLFPANGADPAGWVPAVGASSPWMVVSDEAFAGPHSLKSGLTGDGAQSGIRYVANFRDGMVRFNRKVSSELSGDYLRFYVDGVLKNEWSGNVDWAPATASVSAGVHEVTWQYEKNSSAAAGSDAGWIDSVELPLAFKDVAAGHWAFDYIHALRDARITTGCGPGNYCPIGFVTREQMAAFIVRAKEGNLPANYCAGLPPFADVSPSSWACGHIKRLAELNIDTGCGSGNYCPTRTVTRDEMAAVLARAFLGM